VFTNDSFQIYSSDKVELVGDPIFTGYQESGLYHIEVPKNPDIFPSAFLANTVPDNNFTLLHERYNHCSNNRLKKMREQGVIENLEWTKAEYKSHLLTMCEACARGKMHMNNTSRKSLKGEPRKEYEVGELIFMDVFFSSVESIGGNKCTLILTDAKSRKVWLCHMRNKSDVPEKFIGWLDQMKLEGIKIGSVADAVDMTVRSDNGGEFMSNEFCDILILNLIHKETAPPYTHVAVAERTILTVKEAIRTSIIAASVELTHAAKLLRKATPFVFWCEAANTAVYHLNMMPGSQSDTKSRNELFSGEIHGI